MKKSFMSISMLVVSISMLALFLCSSAINAQASSKFIYDKSENSETVYTLDKSGKYLTPKLQYEYHKETKGNKETKKAYRWNESERKYNRGFENDILSYVLYKWNPVEENWEADQYLLCGDYLALEADSMN